MVSKVDTAGAAYDGLRPLVGDLHNHCGISYGHGSIEDAFANARMQLDFASVTGHGYWHDIPDELPEDDYHRVGFQRLAEMWPHVQQVTEQANEPHSFVSFLSFEWHSRRHGDYCVYYNGGSGEIMRADSLRALQDQMRSLRREGKGVMAIPHHIGYPKGHRGLNWDDFEPEFSPVVEMVSMHGCAEREDAPLPYLHVMGPRDRRSMVVEGLRRGFRFGLIGSSDHHSAHPGSHGHGRVGVWADELTRDSIWDAIVGRRTYALTGDRIEPRVTVADAVMGSETTARGPRIVDIDISAVDAIELVDVVCNGHVVKRWAPIEQTPPSDVFDGFVPIDVGWGFRGLPIEWDVTVDVVGGRLVGVEPQFKGDEVLDPNRADAGAYAYSSWSRTGRDSCRFTTRTLGNPTTTTDGTQGVALHVSGDDATSIIVRCKDLEVDVPIGDLRQGGIARHLAGTLRGSVRVGRASDRYERCASFQWVDDAERGPEASYYVRIRQANGQMAWTSPTWVSMARHR